MTASKSATDRPPVAERIAEAAAERDAGIERVEAAADPRAILMIDAQIQAAVDSGRRFSANDIREKFPVTDEHLVGARIRSFAARRVDGHPVMVRVGLTPSTLKSTHSHEIKVWLGYDAHQALHRNRQEQPA